MPHRQFWIEVAGLVEDGVNFTRETVHGKLGRNQGRTQRARGRSSDSKERSNLLSGAKEKKTSNSKDKSTKGKSSGAGKEKRKAGKSTVGDGTTNPSAGDNYGATAAAPSQTSTPGSVSEVRPPSAAGTAAGDGAYSSFRHCSAYFADHKLYWTSFVLHLLAGTCDCVL